uniref:Uncharacterized protein n=1 Tax=Arundo donax TaxID=35708 RepID=A0A0A9AUW4_ARUDO
MFVAWLVSEILVCVYIV